MLTGIFGYLANAFIGTFIEKAINGLLTYIERANTIKQAKELGTSEQVARDQTVVADAQAQINEVGSERRETAKTKEKLRDHSF